MTYYIPESWYEAPYKDPDDPENYLEGDDLWEYLKKLEKGNFDELDES